MSDTTTTIKEEEATQLPVDTQITLNDLAILLQVVDLATTRGAFKANELSQIGSVFDKVSAFLAAADADKKAKEADAADADTEQQEA